MDILEKSRLPMIDAGEHEVVGKLLNELATSMPGAIQPLEWLVELYGRTSDSFRLPDALAHLGDALVDAHQWERAKKTFEQLVERDPDSDSAKRRLNGALKKMGLLAPGEVAEELPEENLVAEIPKPPAAKLPVQEEESAPEPPPKPAVASTEAGLDEETQKFISQSLTDVDLFASYGLTQKAIGLLEAILRRAPRHTPTLEKLLDFVLGAGDDRHTAELAAQLEQIHSETGDKRSSERFGELRRRFQRAAGLTDADLAIAVPATKPAALVASAPEPMDGSIPEIAAEPAPEEPAPVAAPPPPTEKAPPKPVEVNAAPPQAEVQEVDLSDEWATLLEETRPSEAAVAPSAKAPAKPAAGATRPAKPGEVEEFEIGEEPPTAPPADAPGVAAFEAADAAPASPLQPEPITEKTKAKPEAAKPKQAPPAKAPQKPPKVSEPEFELEQEYELVLDAEPLVPAYDQKPPDKPVAPPAPVARNNATPPSGSGFASDQFLADLANEIDQLGIGELAPGFSGSMPNAQPTPPAKPMATPANSGESSPLKEVFDEFRAELGEMGAEDEDLETHYNLGIAFREMGLLEEAISEFQKVAKASDRGRAFRYTMQCCTLLGLAFMEKGQPAIAAIWYERALKTPGNDPESTLALRYDLGVAQESAGEPEAALKSFSQVYAMNIDYRGVAERIAALQKPIRRS
jgi:tetratricopeptide (TPR) repeat protein